MVWGIAKSGKATGFDPVTGGSNPPTPAILNMENEMCYTKEDVDRIILAIKDQGVREELRKFTHYQDWVLAENDHRGGWRNLNALELLMRIHGEIGELIEVVSYHIKNPKSDAGKEDVMKECADVANYAMMLWDNIQRGDSEPDEPLPF